MAETGKYVRYQATQPNHRGTFPGVFALANGLSRDGLLAPEDQAWWRSANNWCNGAYADPCSEAPKIYDRTLNPGAQSWFKSSAQHLLKKADEYRDLLTRYGVDCDRILADDPGKVVYADDVQVVVVPYSAVGLPPEEIV